MSEKRRISETSKNCNTRSIGWYNMVCNNIDIIIIIFHIYTRCSPASSCAICFLYFDGLQICYVYICVSIHFRILKSKQLDWFQMFVLFFSCWRTAKLAARRALVISSEHLDEPLFTSHEAAQKDDAKKCIRSCTAFSSICRLPLKSTRWKKSVVCDTAWKRRCR